MLRPVTAATTAAALLLVPAVADAAPTVAFDKTCYSKVPLGGSEPVVATISGGSPGGRFQLVFTVPGTASGTAGSQTGDFDAAGNAVVTYPDIRPPRTTLDASKGQRIDASITDYAAGVTEAPVGSFRVTTLSFDVDSTPRNPRRKRAVHVSGTPFAGQTVYGFITKPGSSRVLKSFQVGKGTDCGYVERRVVVAPSRYRIGKYDLYFNAGSKLDRSKALRGSFQIFRRYF